MNTEQVPERPLIWMGATAEKEGMSEQEFRRQVKIIKEQLRGFEERKCGSIF